MQLMNDDMDDLFRRAAENYPLNTNTADWNEIQKKLLAASNQPPPPPKKYNKSLWLLLLLLPAMWIGVESISNRTHAPLTPGVGTQEERKEQKISEGNYQSNNTATKIQQVSRYKPVSSYRIKSGSNLTTTVTRPAYELVSRTGGAVTTEPVTKSVNWFSAEIEPAITPSLENDYELLRGDIPVISADKINGLAETSEKNSVQLSGDQKKKSSKLAKHAFYAGVMVSPDISTVKSQRVNNLGSGIGLILGYEFNKHFNLESGILFDKKYYYSSGEYVNTKRIALPGYSKVKNVTGICKMIELPLDLKYNFTHRGKSYFSAGAGVSSYFMQKEIYDYTLGYYGWDEQRRSIYKKSSSDLLAVMSLSAGYNKSMGKNTNLIISPYLKIPLKGVGIGSLPITSAGVNIGITKKLLKF
jgi:hypothetical protein